MKHAKLVTFCFIMIGLTAGYLLSQVYATTQQPLQAAQPPPSPVSPVVVQVHSVLVLPTDTPTPQPTATPKPTQPSEPFCNLLTPKPGTVCTQPVPPANVVPVPTLPECYSQASFDGALCVIGTFTTWQTPPPIGNP